jgi:hypothetical protein
MAFRGYGGTVRGDLQGAPPPYPQMDFELSVGYPVAATRRMCSNRRSQTWWK